ncbi:hypothetical protein HDU96_000213 [Phlyctochytrium bullatum]|nr:hypothetical protein HDU96_000213 [Phlyctochytrium bullatum]
MVEGHRSSNSAQANSLRAAERDELEAKAADGDADATKGLQAIAEFEAKRDHPATEANQVVV